jgi:hypothetical protein
MCLAKLTINITRHTACNQQPLPTPCTETAHQASIDSSSSYTLLHRLLTTDNPTCPTEPIFDAVPVSTNHVAARAACTPTTCHNTPACLHPTPQNDTTTTRPASSHTQPQVGNTVPAVTPPDSKDTYYTQPLLAAHHRSAHSCALITHSG